MTELPESMLQFGESDFLFGCVAPLVQEANAAGQGFGRILAVQSCETERTRRLQANAARYRIDIRGLQEGSLVEESREVDSLSRALVTLPDWEEIVDAACSPELRFVVSDTTQKERTLLDVDDDRSGNSPLSFPAQLAELLNVRYESGLPGLTMLPCEPIADNADALLTLVQAQSLRWGWEGRFTYWLETECRWLNTLPDRIVLPTPDDPSRLSVEPFALWVVEGSMAEPPVFANPMLGRSLRLNRYRLRKERLFDAVQVELAQFALSKGFTTVHEAVTDAEIAAWLHRRLFEEALPALEGQIDNGDAYARHTLERLANPLLERSLRSLLPTRQG